MIKLKNLILEIIAERMSYQQLMSSSDSARKDRASRIPSKSLAVKSVNDREAWKFSYKTPKDENTTGLRHQGFIYFFKEDIQPGDNAQKIDCSVDCSCPDYRYRFSYANKAAGAGENGSNSLNKGLNYPSSINEGPGLCKHLISLKEYLKTEIEGEPTEPEEPVQGVKPIAVPKSPPPEKMPPEEPEEPEVPKDPTQTPKEPEQEEPVEPKEPIAKTDQTPQGPEEVPQEEEPKQPADEKEPEQKKLKETKKQMTIQQVLDNICNKHPLFVLKYD